MTTQKQARTDADPTHTTPNPARPWCSAYSERHSLSKFHAFDIASTQDTTHLLLYQIERASILSKCRFHDRWGVLQRQANEPNGNIGKIYRYSNCEHRQPSAELVKRANEPNENLGRICRLSVYFSTGSGEASKTSKRTQWKSGQFLPINPSRFPPLAGASSNRPNELSCPFGAPDPMKMEPDCECAWFERAQFPEETAKQSHFGYCE